MRSSEYEVLGPFFWNEVELPLLGLILGWGDITPVPGPWADVRTVPIWIYYDR